MKNFKKLTKINMKNENYFEKGMIDTLHCQFKRYGTNAKEWVRKCVLLLPEIEKYEVWRKKKFGSIYEYAAKLAGMSRVAVDDALRILKKIEDKPELKKVVEEKGINSVRPVVSIANVETAGFWAEKARIMSKHTLEVYVKEVRKNDLANPRTGTGIQPEKVTISMELSRNVAEKLEKLKGAQGNWDDLIGQLLELREKQLEDNKPQEVATDSRHIQNKIRRYVTAKTNNQCAFPGCGRACEILHHADRFALQKVHNPDRIVPLCEEHERLAHLGLIENEIGPVEKWVIRGEADRKDMKYFVDQKVSKYRLLRLSG